VEQSVIFYTFGQHRHPYEESYQIQISQRGEQKIEKIAAESVGEHRKGQIIDTKNNESFT